MNKEPDEISALSFETPIGPLTLLAGAEGLTGLLWSSGFEIVADDPNEHLLLGRKEIEEYLSGQRFDFSVRIDFSRWQGFPLKVYKELQSIPYGQTVTYGELASRAGHPRAARAVGRLMARNPLPIFLPCHRVIAANGDLTGYSGGEGITTKRYLLALEKTA